MTARVLDRSNAALYRLAITAMEIRPDSQVLDVGFGGGAALAVMARLADRGLVAGVDISDTMVARAQKRYRKLIELGRLQIKKGSADNIPFQDHTFDSVCSLNTLYFLPSVEAALREMRRVLKPGGVLVLGTRPKALMEKAPFTRYGFRLFEEAELERLVSGAGFREVHFERTDTALCTVGRA